MCEITVPIKHVYLVSSEWLIKAAEIFLLIEQINYCSVFNVSRSFFYIAFCLSEMTVKVLEVVLDIYLRGNGGLSCYYRGCVLRHVLRVERVQTHGEGKRTGRDCTTTEMCPLREQPGSLRPPVCMNSLKLKCYVSPVQIFYRSVSVHDASVGES